GRPEELDAVDIVRVGPPPDLGDDHVFIEVSRPLRRAAVVAPGPAAGKALLHRPDGLGVRTGRGPAGGAGDCGRKNRDGERVDGCGAHGGFLSTVARHGLGTSNPEAITQRPGALLNAASACPARRPCVLGATARSCASELDVRGPAPR